MEAVSEVGVPSRSGPRGEQLLDLHQVGLHADLESLRNLQHQRVVSGLQVWDLSMVNPDLAPPRQILDRLLESVTKISNHRYAVSRGVRRLREGFSVKYQTRFGCELDPEKQVCVCLGSKDATFHALRALLQPGDSVVVLSPSYPAHPSAVALAGGRAVAWEFSQDVKVASTSLEAVLKQSRAKVVLLNLPSNPLGLTVSEGWWNEIGGVCARAGATIINDFVYGEMCFSGRSSASSLRATSSGARCLEVYSLSKAYNVPGWRVGALVGDSEIVGAVSRLKSNADYGLFLPLQYAAATALTSSEDLVGATVQTYERRLKVLGDGLRGLGWSMIQPEAGACLWAKYPASLAEQANGSRYRSIAVVQHVLERTGVVLTPGVLCGAEFDGWVRFAAVSNEERLRDVIRALRGV
jgi:alanine-synthesizing transaminase